MDNKTLHKWIMYSEVHKQHCILGKKPSQIAADLGIDTRTVKRLLNMDQKQYEAYLIKNSSRRKKLRQYEDYIKQRIENCPEASAAQVHDWLKESHPGFIPVSERTIYNFVVQVRNKYGLAKVFTSREFSMVEELPYGQQAQVDFGEYTMTDTEAKRKKVYLLTMVLSRSRYKHVIFSTEPFTTQTAIQALEHGFAFFEGHPAELVMDQDKLLLYRENKGDLILTDKFREYCQGQPFRLYFCRKNDPQSKGKIENVVKYIKYNFLRGRPFYDIHTLNVQAKEWLFRTANAKVHATIHKVPAQEWDIEKSSLYKLNTFSLMPDNKATHSVSIDNAISYKGNRYSVPIGTYKGPSTLVFTQEENDQLVICDQNSMEIVRHKISLLKGVQIRNNNHFRNADTKISELINKVADMFTHKDNAIIFLEQIRKQKPRYVRDQVKTIERAFSKYNREIIDQALVFCTENKIYNATDFEPVIRALCNMKEETIVPSTEKSPVDKYTIIPEKSNISDYEQILN